MAVAAPCLAVGPARWRDQRCFGAGSGEGEADALDGFDNAGADFKGFQAQRRELGDGHQARAPSGWRRVARASASRRWYEKVRTDRSRSARKPAKPDLVGES